jgi:hypothetical protein
MFGAMLGAVLDAMLGAGRLRCGAFDRVLFGHDLT